LDDGAWHSTAADGGNRPFAVGPLSRLDAGIADAPVGSDVNGSNRPQFCRSRDGPIEVSPDTKMFLPAPMASVSMPAMSPTRHQPIQDTENWEGKIAKDIPVRDGSFLVHSCSARSILHRPKGDCVNP
jgi:hypothetical protein